MVKEINILVVDDDRRMASTLADILKVKGYKAESVYSAREAMEKIEKADFDCVITDIKMPVVNGVELYRKIKAVRPEMPVVLMTAYSADRLVREGLEEGAIASLAKPLDLNLLLGFFYSLRKERTIVIIDDDPSFCKTMGDILRLRGFKVVQIEEPSDAVEELKENGQVLLLDMKLKGVTALDILKTIRKRHPSLPVILTTGYRKEMEPIVEAALKISAYTCLYKPFQIDELLSVLTEVRHQELRRVLGKRTRKRS